jgi:hypothetical protein
MRDTVVARVPASSGILFPPPFGKLEGDGPWVILYAFFAVSLVLQCVFYVATDDFHMLQWDFWVVAIDVFCYVAVLLPEML